MKTKQPKRLVVISWLILWLGTVFSVSSLTWLRTAGTTLWLLAIGLQLFIVFNWLKQLRDHNAPDTDRARVPNYP